MEQELVQEVEEVFVIGRPEAIMMSIDPVQWVSVGQPPGFSDLKIIDIKRENNKS